MKTTAKDPRKSASSKKSKDWKMEKGESKASPMDVYEKFTNLILDKLEHELDTVAKKQIRKGL